jgi:hypothetical protein
MENRGSEVQAANKPNNLNTLRSRLMLPDNPTSAGKHDNKMMDEGCSHRESTPAEVNLTTSLHSEKNMDGGCTLRGRGPAISASVWQGQFLGFPPSYIRHYEAN